MAGSYFMTGGIIGQRVVITDTERYILGTQEVEVQVEVPGTPVFANSTGRSTFSGATLTLPSGLQPGDLVIYAGASDGTTPATPSGYTSGQSGRPSSTGYRWAYKFMPDPVDSTITGLTSDGQTTHLALAFRNVDPDTVLDVTSPGATNGATGNPNPPSITTVSANSVVVAIGYLDDDLIQATAGAPSGYTFAAASQSTSAGVTVMAAYRTVETAGAEDPGAFSGGDDDWAATTLALRGAPETANVIQEVTVFGNQKNSGIWNLRAVFRGSLIENPVSVVDHTITESDGSTTVSSLDVTVPNDVVAGDLLVIMCGNDYSAGTTPAQWDDSTLKPSGFTLIKQITTATADACCAAFYKVAAGTEGGTTINVPAQSSQDMWAGCMVVRNVDTTNPIYVIGENRDNASSTTHAIPGVATLADTMMVFVCSVDGSDTAPYVMVGGEADDFISTAAGSSATSVGGGFGWKFIDTDRTTLDQTVSLTGAGGADGLSGFQFAIKGV